ncbi:outer dynein arm-docking complex subunit 4 isoform X1 [Scophthalmus maximus]|uniref:outer dynein arm-docking complex subunit 4 isoform X1 n=1 Tax=Scophthalmus maximus TaxID=52904 RepID=UPI0015E11A35|nr:outer dynein arm-docking complex subunit 4 isoform X1 [Scophthalmus maximus]
MSDTAGDREDQFSTIVADGNWLYIKGEYKKAIESFSTALTLKPDERNCFVGRSKCYLNMGLYENALKDAEASLKEDTTFFEGLYQKAEALYYMGEFEFALVFYHRGQKLRPQIQEFRLGIQKAQEAIENCVGSPSVKLEIKGDLSFLQKDEEMTQPITAIEDLTKENKQQTQKTPKIEKRTKKLLGEFYNDGKYLESLLKDEDLVKGKTKGGESLQDVIQGSLTHLDACTEFSNQEKPINAQGKDHKTQQKCGKPGPSASSEQTNFLLKSLEEIDAELTSGNAEGSLKKAEEVMEMVQRWSEKEVPNKQEVLGSLHSCIGNALINLGDMDKALVHHQKDLELAKQCNHSEAMSRAMDNIGKVYAQTGHLTLAIGFWEKKIPLVRDPLEKTCLFHEIGWCYLKLDRYEEARDYGVRSLAAADETADDKWQMNANVLVAQSEMKLGNVESSVARFERALTQAKLQEDDSAMNSIQKALDEAKPQ